MASLQMPEPTVPRRPLKSFKALSFDIYGTVIDWESSITRQLAPLLERLPKNHHLNQSSGDEQKRLLTGYFNDDEVAIITEQPGIRYDKALAEVYVRIAQRLGVDKIIDEATLHTEAAVFGADIGSWQAFPDSVAALQRLQKHYWLIALSNIDRASFSKTLAGPLAGFSFDATYLAESIGSYKPDLKNFYYLINRARVDFGIEKDDILHTAQGLAADHVPAKEMRMSSVWIAREGQAMGGGPGGAEVEKVVSSGMVGFGWSFATLGDMADAVDREDEP